MYSAKSRCKAAICRIGDFFTLKSLHSPNFIILRSIQLCPSSASAGDTFLYFTSVGQKTGDKLLAEPVESFVCKDSGFVLPHGSVFLNKLV